MSDITNQKQNGMSENGNKGVQIPMDELEQRTSTGEVETTEDASAQETEIVPAPDSGMVLSQNFQYLSVAEDAKAQTEELGKALDEVHESELNGLVAERRKQIEMVSDLVTNIENDKKLVNEAAAGKVAEIFAKTELIGLQERSEEIFAQGFDQGLELILEELKSKNSSTSTKEKASKKKKLSSADEALKLLEGK